MVRVLAAGVAAFAVAYAALRRDRRKHPAARRRLRARRHRHRLRRDRRTRRRRHARPRERPRLRVRRPGRRAERRQPHRLRRRGPDLHARLSRGGVHRGGHAHGRIARRPHREPSRRGVRATRPAIEQPLVVSMPQRASVLGRARCRLAAPRRALRYGVSRDLPGPLLLVQRWHEPGPPPLSARDSRVAWCRSLRGGP